PADCLSSASTRLERVSSSQLSDPTNRTAGTRLRAAISIPASTSSFTAFAFAPGALNTGTPRSLIAFTGMLFVPAPARPIARTHSGTFIAFISCERTRIASGCAASLETLYPFSGMRFSPACAMCPGTLIPLAELEAYREKAIAEKLVDQQVRDIDIGKAHIGIGMVYRGKLDKPAPDSVAEHDQVSEVYHIISGSATLVLGPDITNRQRRPATQRTVVEFNGPGNNGSDIRNGVAYNLKVGDVVVIPAGTRHWFTKIDD